MKGIVMEIKDGKAVVFQKNGDVKAVRDRGYRVGQTVTTPSAAYRRTLAAAACIALALIAGGSGYAMYRLPASYVYVEVNPGLRLEVNRFDKVVSVVPLSGEAEGLLAAYPLRAAEPEACIDAIIDACREAAYLTETDNDVALSVVTNNAALEARMHAVSERLRGERLRVVLESADKEENERAMTYRTSPGRLRAVEAYTAALGGSLEENFSALRGMTIKEIYAALAEAGFSPAEGARRGVSPDRLRAVEAYTAAFGGSLEENTEALRSFSVREIYDAIEQKQPQQGAAPNAPQE